MINFDDDEDEDKCCFRKFWEDGKLGRDGCVNCRVTGTEGIKLSTSTLHAESTNRQKHADRELQPELLILFVNLLGKIVDCGFSTCFSTGSILLLVALLSRLYISTISWSSRIESVSNFGLCAKSYLHVCSAVTPSNSS